MDKEPMGEERQPKPKRPRGRPRNPNGTKRAKAMDKESTGEEELPKRPKGRSRNPNGMKRAKAMDKEPTGEERPPKPKRPRGRPRNPNGTKRAKASDSPRPRGRPKGSKNKPKTAEQLEELRTKREGKMMSIDGKFPDLALLMGENEPIMTMRRTLIRPFAPRPEDRTQELVTFLFASKAKN